MKKLLAILSCIGILSGTLAFTACGSTEETTELTVTNFHLLYDIEYKTIKNYEEQDKYSEKIDTFKYDVTYLKTDKELYADISTKTIDSENADKEYWRNKSYCNEYYGSYIVDDGTITGKYEYGLQFKYDTYETIEEADSAAKSKFIPTLNYLVGSLKSYADGESINTTVTSYRKGSKFNIEIVISYQFSESKEVRTMNAELNFSAGLKSSDFKAIPEKAN